VALVGGLVTHVLTEDSVPAGAPVDGIFEQLLEEVERALRQAMLGKSCALIAASLRLLLFRSDGVVDLASCALGVLAGRALGALVGAVDTLAGRQNVPDLGDDFLGKVAAIDNEAIEGSRAVDGLVLGDAVSREGLGGSGHCCDDLLGEGVANENHLKLLQWLRSSGEKCRQSFAGRAILRPNCR
jgi:hypothetical protein